MSEVPERFSGAVRGCRGGNHTAFSIYVALKRTADDVAGAKSDGKGQRENDAAEQDAEGQLDDGAADFKMVKDHGGGEN